MYTLISETNAITKGNILSIASTQNRDDKLYVCDSAGNELGYLAVAATSLLPGSQPAQNLTLDDVKGNAFIMQRRKGKDFTFSLIDLFPEKYSLESEDSQDNTDGSETVLLFAGTQTTTPGKAEMLRRLADGPVPCSMSVDAGTIVVKDEKGRKAGRLVNGQAFPEIFSSQLVVQGEARMPQKDWSSLKHGANPYEVVIGKTKAADTGFGMFQDIITKLNENCIDHPQAVAEKIRFMQAAGISDAVIQKVLESYVCYAGEDRFKIKKPDFPFMDNTSGYLNRCIAYMLTGANIRLVGNKGCGKNTLLNTLSWLFHQPLFKIGCSERTDEYTVFGSTQVKNGDTIHKLSPFAHGLTIGAMCILDEANMVPPELLSAINQLTDDTREVDLSNYGLLKLHSRTRVFMTMNEDYQGTCQLNDATLDRFQGIFMDAGMSIEQLLRYLVPGALMENITTCGKVFNKVMSIYKEGQISESAITIRGYTAALKAADLLPLRTCLEDSISGRCQDAAEREIIRSAIQMFCV